MEQDILKANLNGLERKLLLVLNEYKSMKREIESLKSEHTELRTQLKVKDKLIANFKNQINSTKIVTMSSLENENVLELKRTVNEYILEINKCIAHLSS